MILIFLGAPGSGKDTQAELLIRYFGFTVISTGQLFRDAIQSNTQLGEKIKEKYKKGLLMNDTDVKNVLSNYFANTPDKNIAMTGVVRTMNQVKILDDIFIKYNRVLSKVIYFDVPDEIVIERLSNRLVCDKDNSIIYHKIFNPPTKINKCTKIGGKLIQRTDDKPETIKVRLEEFHKKSHDVLNLYKSRGELIKIDATLSIKKIHELVKKAIQL